jgi:hypothetical protein
MKLWKVGVLGERDHALNMPIISQECNHFQTQEESCRERHT